VAAWVLHVDLDEFLAAVEVLRRPELAGRPVVVGGAGDPTRRGVVATASYAARAFGVHSGMPLRTAARRCPGAVFLPADNPAYEAASAQVLEVLRGFEVVVEVLGWDEAFLGATTDDPESLAATIRAAVLDRTGLHCSVGIGDNTLRAKLATGFAKPRGVFRLTRENWSAVMGELPTGALWGIGRRTAPKLAALGITTVGELAAADPAELAAHLGPSMGPWYVQLGAGIGRVQVHGEPYVARSRSRETTFQENLDDPERIRAEVDALARRVAADVAVEGRPAVRVGLKVRFAPFWTATRSAALPAPTGDPDALAAAAVALLDRFDERDRGRPVRLLGVRAEFPPPA
jgi:DNA polymerase-4